MSFESFQNSKEIHSFLIKKFQLDTLQKEKPSIEHCENILLYLFKLSITSRNMKKLLKIARVHWKDDFFNFSKKYLNENLESPFQFINDQCIGIIMFIFNQIINYQSIKNSEIYYQLLKYLPLSIENYIDDFLKSSKFQTPTNLYRLLTHLSKINPKKTLDIIEKYQNGESYSIYMILILGSIGDSVTQSLVPKYIEILLSSLINGNSSEIILTMQGDFNTVDRLKMIIQFGKLFTKFQSEISKSSSKCFYKAMSAYFKQNLELVTSSDTEILKQIKSNVDLIFGYFYNPIIFKISDSSHWFNLYNTILGNDVFGKLFLDGSETISDILKSNFERYSPSTLYLNGNTWNTVLTEILDNELMTYKEVEDTLFVFLRFKKPFYQLANGKKLAKLLTNVPDLTVYDHLILSTNYHDLNLTLELYELYKAGKCPYRETVHQYIEASLFLTLYSKTYKDSDILNSITSFYQSPQSLYDRIHISDSNDLVTLNMVFSRIGHICLQSSHFKQFYFKIPISIKGLLKQTNITYQLELEDYSNKYDISNSNSNNISIDILPKLILNRIVMCFYQDFLVCHIAKLRLASVSKRFFDSCRHVLSNFFNSDMALHYIDIMYFRKIQVNSQFSLYKNYPKMLSYQDRNYIPMDVFEDVFHNQCQTLSIKSLSLHKFPPQFPISIGTNLKDFIVQITESPKITPGHLMTIFTCSKHLERISIRLFTMWPEIHNMIESVLDLDLNLKEFHVQDAITQYDESKSFYLAPIIEKQLEKNPKRILPKFFLLTKNLCHFNGFNVVNIQLSNQYNFALDSQTVIFHYSNIFKNSPSIEKIVFVVNDLEIVKPLVELVTQFTNCIRLSFRLPKVDYVTVPDISIVQSIFDQVSLNSNLITFSIYYGIMIPTTLPLFHNQLQLWSQIDTKQFKPHYNYLHFFK
ncbi:hypothetical protein DLAC_05758 [Tieghemostelium lacteum]|uniref:Uncharacterized protein n=1 Tax=Tieghemostelium lacteum TaxID=361077 RepID=A0A151ZGU4_TIELA|nr:hypothetical protein DLAC_05758 [Tieghemostelium lacteum]|eukprot:KYQ93129.1 hypothetical protein DLAC_05758 [Tieghemostelium lacteum]